MDRTRNRVLENFTVLFILSLVVYLPASALPVPGATRYQPSLSSPVLVTAASSSGTVGSNVPIVGEASPDRQQVETAISVDPRSQNILVAGAQDLRLKSLGEHRWNGYCRSWAPATRIFWERGSTERSEEHTSELQSPVHLV